MPDFGKLALWQRIGRYRENADPLAAAANLVSLVLAWNTPFYPLYLWWIAGPSIFPAALLTLCSTPFWACIPALARRNSLAGRAALPLVGMANIVFCTKLLGEAAGAEMMYAPCILLACVLSRSRERWLMLPLAALPIVLFFALHGHYGPPLHACTPAQSAAILRLNAGSLGTLSLFLGLIFSNLRQPDQADS